MEWTKELRKRFTKWHARHPEVLVRREYVSQGGYPTVRFTKPLFGPMRGLAVRPWYSDGNLAPGRRPVQYILYYQYSYNYLYWNGKRWQRGGNPDVWYPYMW